MATLNAFTAEAIAIVALMTLKLDWVRAFVLAAAALIGIALAFVPGQRALAKAEVVEAVRQGRRRFVWPVEPRAAENPS